MTGPIVVGVVHSGRLIRDGVCDLLSRQSDLEVRSAYASVADVAARPIPGPHVLLLDVLTARAAGAATMALHAGLPEAKILMFNVEDDDRAIVECVRAGAAGCVLVDATVEELLAAVHALWSGLTPQSPRVMTSLFSYVASLERGEERPAAAAALTPREEQILALMAEGLSNKEIAARLVLQHQTVKNYAHLVMQKLDLHSRLDVMRAFRDHSPVSRRGTAPH